jgi:hypothetical protein
MPEILKVTKYVLFLNLDKIQSVKVKCQLYQEISRQIAKHEFVTGKKQREKKIQNFR